MGHGPDGAWTRADARKDPHGYQNAVDERGGDWPCEYGHLGCATHHRGPCVDEVMTEHEARVVDGEECEQCDMDQLRGSGRS